MKRTKIVCTLGPSSESYTKIKKLIAAGMDVARLNFSHGTYENHTMLMTNVRKAAKELGKTVALLQDLQGPKIRVAELPKLGVKIKKNEIVSFVQNHGTIVPEGETEKKIPVDYNDLYKYVAPGERMLLADGLMDVKVLAVENKVIKAKVVNGGTVFSHKGINIPDSKEVIASLTEKDIRDLAFGIKSGVDYVALSFVQTADDIKDLKKRISRLEKKHGLDGHISTKIISKIEKRQAIQNFEAILEETDGIMVARGDLGIETPLQDVPLLQKQIIEQCLEVAKPVITATQMLDSMTVNPRPTRAEVSDVANAVIDHTDAVMLSGETASGRFPVATVRTMRDIIKDTEESPYDDLVLETLARQDLTTDVAISNVAVRLSKNVKADAILIVTISGYTARAVSRYRPEIPIVVTAESEKVKRQLALSWGVCPLVIPPCRNVDELINKAVDKAKEENLIKKGQRIIIIGGQPVGKAGNVNLIKVHEVKE